MSPCQVHRSSCIESTACSDPGVDVGIPGTGGWVGRVGVVDGRAGGCVALIVHAPTVGGNRSGGDAVLCASPSGVDIAVPHAANIAVSSRRNDRRGNTPVIVAALGGLERGHRRRPSRAGRVRSMPDTSRALSKSAVHQGAWGDSLVHWCGPGEKGPRCSWTTLCRGNTTGRASFFPWRTTVRCGVSSGDSPQQGGTGTRSRLTRSALLPLLLARHRSTVAGLSPQQNLPCLQSRCPLKQRPLRGTRKPVLSDVAACRTMPMTCPSDRTTEARCGMASPKVRQHRRYAPRPTSVAECIRHLSTPLAVQVG